MEQGTTEWHQARLGKVTASKVADVIARTKSGWGASRANYTAQLVVERLTGQPTETYTNSAMQHGIDTEPEARIAYEFYRSVEVKQVAFINHPDISMSGASPDGLVADGEGLVEIKCPSSATHIETLLGGKIPDKYVVQMQWQMACSGALWCDWASYDPRMPEELRLFVHRVERDNERIKRLEKDVTDFLAEVDAKVEKLNKLQQEVA